MAAKAIESNSKAATIKQPFSYISLSYRSPMFEAIFKARGWEFKQQEFLAMTSTDMPQQ